MMEMSERERELFDSLMNDAKTHSLLRDAKGVLRFEQRVFPVCHKDAIRDAWYNFHFGAWSEARFHQFYRDIGYSLGGYCELVDQGAI